MERIKIKVNGHPYYTTKNKNAARAAVLSLFTEDVAFMSAQAIQQTLRSVEKMMYELGISSRRRILSLIRREGSSIPPRKEALHQFYNTLLSAEGLAPLWGMGLAVTESTEEGRTRIVRRIPHNPETSSVYELQKSEKE